MIAAQNWQRLTRKGSSRTPSGKIWAFYRMQWQRRAPLSRPPSEGIHTNNLCTPWIRNPEVIALVRQPNLCADKFNLQCLEARPRKNWMIRALIASIFYHKLQIKKSRRQVRAGKEFTVWPESSQNHRKANYSSIINQVKITTNQRRLILRTKPIIQQFLVMRLCRWVIRWLAKGIQWKTSQTDKVIKPQIQASHEPQ